MTDYNPLRDYLSSVGSNTNVIELSLERIEELLGRELPQSAKKYSQWWDNKSVDHGHTQAHAWLDAGWEKTGFSRSKHLVRFSRKL